MRASKVPPLATVLLALMASHAVAAGQLAPGVVDEGPTWEGFAVVTLNLVPQELDSRGVPLQEDLPGQQRLVSSSRFDCTTGLPSADGSRYAMDVVPLIGNVALGARVDAVPFPNPQGGGGFAASVFAGYGYDRPESLYPGTLSFHAFLWCGETVTGRMPAALPGQTLGIFGYHDELEWEDAAEPGPRTLPEFSFAYVSGSGPDDGLLPRVVMTPGWYMTEALLWAGEPSAIRSTFRFVANPSLSPDHPGYTGSRFSGIMDRSCLFRGDDEPGVSCDARGLTTDFYGWSPEVAPAVEGAPPPLLEDVEVYFPPDGTLGVNLAEPAWLETQAASAEALGIVASQVPPLPRPGRLPPPEPNHPADGSVQPIDSGWEYYFDLRPQQSLALYALREDPLYAMAMTSGGSGYPGLLGFRALLGLWRDANGDHAVDTLDPQEWFPVADALASPDGRETLGNWADVGEAAPGGNDLAGGSLLATIDYCSVPPEPRLHDATTAAPVGSPDIEHCNPLGDPDAGWGTLHGDPSDISTGIYRAYPDHVTATGSLVSPLTTEVRARIAWPLASLWARGGLVLPQGLDYGLFAGTTVFLHDTDVLLPPTPPA